MKWDSPAVLSTAGTLAIHILLAIIGNALIVAVPAAPKPAPRLEYVEIEPPPISEPPPPPPAPQAQPEPQAQPAPVTPPPPAPPPRVRATQPRPATPSPAPAPEQPPAPDPSPDSGGGPVTQMADIAPEARGTIPVAKGASQGGRGRGGTGTGTGSGTGAGSSDAPPAPASIATIKSRAMPKGDFSYVDASKDYPAEAKALGIEGVIRVRLVVDVEGSVTSAVLINRLGHGLDELAIERAKKIKFDPAKDTDDKPVSSVVVWTFNMTLPK